MAASFSASATDMKIEPLRRQPVTGRERGLGEGFGETGPDAHDLAGGLHLGAQGRVDAREAREGQHGLLDGDVRQVAPARDAPGGLGLLPTGELEVAEHVAGDDPGGHAGQRDTRGFADEGHGAAAPWVHLEHVDARPAVVALLDGILHVHQTDHSQLEGEGGRLLLDAAYDLIAHRHRRDHAGGVARVHARFFDVLHDGADVDVLAITETVDVDLGGVLEETVDEYRMPRRSLDRRSEVA